MIYGHTQKIDAINIISSLSLSLPLFLVQVNRKINISSEITISLFFGLIGAAIDLFLVTHAGLFCFLYTSLVLRRHPFWCTYNKNRNS